MSERVMFNEFIKPICLQHDKNLRSVSSVGQSVVVAGFGRTEKQTNSNIKLKVALDVVDNNICNNSYRIDGRRITDMQICAGGKKGIDSCRYLDYG